MSWGNTSRGLSPQRPQWGSSGGGTSNYGNLSYQDTSQRSSQNRSTSHSRHHSPPPPANNSQRGYQNQSQGQGWGYNSGLNSSYGGMSSGLNSSRRDTSPSHRPFSSPTRQHQQDYSYGNTSLGGALPQPTSPTAGSGSPITQVSRNQDPFVPQLPLDFIPPEPDPSTFTPLLPPKSRSMANRNTLVLDLDETLVHSSFTPVPRPDMVFDIELDGQKHTVYVKKRPFAEEFLARMNQLYEVVILTASLEVYADPLITRLDRGNWCHHRLYRDSCANLNGNYIKDLSYLGRPLHQVIIIDNSPTSYLFQPRNALPISSWFEEPTDRELWDLLPALERAAPVENIFNSLAQSRSELASQGASGPPPRQW